MLTRILLLASLSATSAYVARGPAALMRSAAPRATFVKPAQFANVRMEAAETAADAAIVDETCIEDEAIEECSLVKWDAGEIKVRRVDAASPSPSPSPETRHPPPKPFGQVWIPDDYAQTPPAIN